MPSLRFVVAAVLLFASLGGMLYSQTDKDDRTPPNRPGTVFAPVFTTPPGTPVRGSHSSA